MNRRTWALVLTAAAVGLAGCGAGTSQQGAATATPGVMSSTTAPATSTSTGSTTPPGATATSSATTSTTGTPATTSTSGTATPSSTTSTSSPTTPSPTTPKPTATTPPPLTDTSTMKPGDRGAAVQRMQQRLSDLGYWLGTPDGDYGYNTTQAVMALQKTAGLGRDGIYGPATRAALDRGVRPTVVVSGNAVQIDIARQVLTIVENGAIVAIVNTSTGSGETYISGNGQPAVATTPRGTFSVILQIDGLDKGPLGDLWRPKYFRGGYAVHGSASVPAYPASHGCARVSNAVMDMIWARDLMPMGRTVVVF